ncbi:MAG TPA: CDP-alcohol phosphatidyltransferase family protein [Chitinivibrionales bacterium]
MLESLKPWYARLLGPAAKVLIKTGIHPNAITLAGLCFSPIAAFMTTCGQWFLAALCIGLGSLMDGLDGLVARQTGKKTTWGAILDSTVDRITEIIWLVGLLVFYSKAENGIFGIFFTYCAMSGSLMVSYVRARSEGAHVPCTSGLAQRPERIILLIGGLLAGPAIMTWGLLGLSAVSYFTVFQRLVETYRYCKKQTER